MNKKILIKCGFYLCVLMAIFCISLLSSASAQEVSLIPSSQVDRCNDADTLWIYCDASITGMKAAGFKIAFDHNRVTPSIVIKGSGLGINDQVFYKIDNANDTLQINIAILGAGVVFDGPDTLVGIVLTADSEVFSTDVSFERSVLRDSLNQNILHTISDATIKIDCTRPTVLVTYPPSGGIYNSLPTLSIDFDDDVGLNRGYYQMDGCTGAWTQLWSYNSGSSDTTISWTVPSVSAGAHTIYFKVTDDAGNANGDTCTYSWSFTYDVSRPTVLVTSPPSGGIYNSLPTLSIDFDDDVGLNRGYYQMDGCTGAWTQLWSYNSGSSDTTISWTVPSVSGGAHTIYFKVTDDAGNANGDTCTYSWSFTYDPGRPTVLVTSPPSGGIYNSLPTLSIDFDDDVGLNRGYYQMDGCTGAWTQLWVYNSGSSDTTIIWGGGESEFTVTGNTVALWHLNENAGSTANDETGNHDGVIDGATWATGRFGSALSFDGNDGVAVPESSDWDTPQLTVQAWVNATSLPTPYNNIVCKGHHPSPTNLGYALTVKNGKLTLLVGNSDGSGWAVLGDARGATTLNTGTWYHVAATYDGEYVRLYVNGELDSNGANNPYYYTGGMHYNRGPIAIGRTFQQIDESWHGLIDEVRISDTALTESEIQEYYTLEAGAHTIYFKVTDDAGNVNGDTCSYSWNLTYDLTLPTVLVTYPPSGGIYNSLPTLSIDFDDDVGLNRGYYQMDGCTGAWTQLWSYNSGSSDTTISWTVPSVSAGAHTIYFKVTDDAGNANGDTCTYSWSFTYDVSRPTVLVTSPPSGGIYNSLPTLSIDFDDDVGLNRGYYQMDGCTGAWTQLWSYNSGSSDTTISWTVPSVSGGAHTIYFKVTDDAGNVNSDTCTYSWSFTYDPGRPTVLVTSPPSGGIYNSLPTLSIDFDDDVGLNRGYYQMDGCTGAWTQLWSYNSGSSDTTISWTVPSVSAGAHTIYFKVTDDVGNSNSDSCSYFWSFTYDITPPAAPTGLVVSPGHQKCKLSWTNPTGDPSFAGVEIRRNPWAVGAYPEYDDDFPTPIGYPADETEGALVYRGSDEIYRDSSGTATMPRNVYYYSIFSYDAAGNYSTATSGQQGRATNYWLGDVGTNGYDGKVYFEDLQVLSNAYWTFLGEPGYDPEFDIGPTYSGSPKGIPTTDNWIDFEDLVVFAINFAAVSPNLKIAPTFADENVSGPLALSLVMPPDELKVEKEFKVKVLLRNNPGTVKGIHFVLPYDPSQLEFVGVDRSDGLKGAPCPVFFDGRDTDHQVDVSLALLGGETTIGGSGEIASITFNLLEKRDLSFSFSLIDLRDGENCKLSAGQEDAGYEAPSQVPSAYGLSQNYPNPYNPQTQIAYQLPQPGMVSLKIYNIRGELVRTLVDEYKPSGYHTVLWDGRNEAGMEVSSGIYFYRMVSGEFSATKKMVMIK